MFRKISLSKFTQDWRIPGIILAFFIYFILRLYRLGYHDLWYDEIYTVGYAQYPWGNWNAPLYWILLYCWIKLFPLSEFSLRLPSLIFNFFSIILVFLLGKELFNKKVGIIASIFIGLSPFHLWYAQEARDYSLVLFLGLLSSLLFYQALKKDKDSLWMYFVLVSLAGLYTNYFYLFLFLAQCLYFVFQRRLKFNLKEMAYFLIIVLGFSFYLPRFLSKFYYICEGFWIPQPTPISLAITLENFVLGYNGTPLLYYISNFLAGIFFLSSLRIMRKKELKGRYAFCIILFLVPIICAFLFSKKVFSVYLDRGLIIFSPYYYLILAAGIAYLDRTRRTVLLILLVTLLMACDYRYFQDRLFPPLRHHLGTYIKKPIRPIAEFLEKKTGAQDIIAFTNESTMPSLRFYSQGRLASFYYLFDPKFPDTSWQRQIQENSYRVPFYKIGNFNFNRLWLISSDWARSGQLDENSRSVKDWLDKNFKLNFVKEFHGLWLFRYSR